MQLQDSMILLILNLLMGLNNAGIKVDRKILADLAVNDPKGFKKLVDLAKKNLNA